MRKRARLATTAGMTVLGFTAMSGIASADTGGLGLNLDLTGPLAKTGPIGKTLDGVVKQTTHPSSTRSSGGSILNLNLPIHLRLGAPEGSGSGRHSAPVVKADVKAGVKVSTNPLAVQAKVGAHLCAHPPQECGRVPSPPSPIPPAPPTPPPTPPVGNPLPPAVPPGAGGLTNGSSSLTVGGDSLPFTGGPISALTLLGAAAVLTGAAGVAGSRLRFGRDV
jgi:hypothetical protein